MNSLLSTRAYHRLAGADGVKLYTVTQGEGPLVLFLHGFPEFWFAWRRQLDEFGRDHLAAAMDLRGYNFSEKPAELSAYTLAAAVEDVRRVLTALSPDRPATLVGHDWGGTIAWAVARAHPELIERLVIVNAAHPAIFARELQYNPAQRKASSYILFFRRPWLPEKALSACNFALLRRLVFDTAISPQAFPAGERLGYRVAWSQPGALTGGLNYYRANGHLRHAHATPDTWRIAVPTLVIWGEADRALLTGNLNGLEDFVPDLRVVRVPDATHWIVHEEPTFVNATIREFLAA